MRTQKRAFPKRLTIVLWIIGAAAVLLLGLWQVSKARCFSLVGSVTCRVETAEPVVALSFDDGPTDRGVKYANEVLERLGVKGTFFLTGREAQARPDLVRALLTGGHEVANHSFSHKQMVGSSREIYEQEIARTHSVLTAAGAEGVNLFRPPYGKKLIGLPLAVQRQGYRTIMWDVEDPGVPRTRSLTQTR